MSALAKSLGGAAPSHTFEFEGRTYALRPITYGMIVELERDLFARKLKALEMTRGLMDPVAYQQRLDSLTARYEAGAFSLENEDGRDFYLGGEGKPPHVEGSLRIGAKVFGTDADTMSRMIVARGPEVRLLLGLVSSEALRGPKSEGDDPNAPAVSPAS